MNRERERIIQKRRNTSIDRTNTSAKAHLIHVKNPKDEERVSERERKKISIYDWKTCFLFMKKKTYISSEVSVSNPKYVL